MFFVLSRAWEKEKNSESPWGIEPQTFGFRASMLYHWATETVGWARSIRNRNLPDVQIFVRSTDIYRRGYLSDDIKIFKRGSQLICLYGAISVVSASKVDQNLWEHNVLISSWIWVGKTKEGSKQTKNNNRQFAHNTRSSGALKCKFLFSLILLSRMNFSWSSAHNP